MILTKLRSEILAWGEADKDHAAADSVANTGVRKDENEQIGLVETSADLLRLAQGGLVFARDWWKDAVCEKLEEVQGRWSERDNADLGEPAQESPATEQHSPGPEWQAAEELAEVVDWAEAARALREDLAENLRGGVHALRTRLQRPEDEEEQQLRIEAIRGREWDVATGGKKEGVVQRATMGVPAAARVYTNVVGGAVAAAAYTAGKIEARVRGKKAIDSDAFRAGFWSWMWANGLFPRCEYEPLDHATVEGLQALYPQLSGDATGPRNMSLTPMLVSNHMSYLDGLMLAAVFRAPKVLAKAGTKGIPIVSDLMQEMDCIWVDRKDPNSRQATLDGIASHCAQWRPGDRPLLIFPEGTTSNGQVLLPFKRGAFVSGLPVRPVILIYTGHFDPASTTYRQTGHGIEEQTDAEWMAQFMGHFVHSAHVRVCPPYLPSEAERADADLYAEGCQAYMAQALARVRAELESRSLKAAAERESGGAWEYGDVERMLRRRLSSSFSSEAEPGT